MTCWLWFDVGFKRYTTIHADQRIQEVLWFDVGFKRYTTTFLASSKALRCGLM